MKTGSHMGCAASVFRSLLKRPWSPCALSRVPVHFPVSLSLWSSCRWTLWHWTESKIKAFAAEQSKQRRWLTDSSEWAWAGSGLPPVHSQGAAPLGPAVGLDSASPEVSVVKARSLVHHWGMLDLLEGRGPLRTARALCFHSFLQALGISTFAPSHPSHEIWPTRSIWADQLSDETSKTVSRNQPFVFINQWLQAFCYSVGMVADTDIILYTIRRHVKLFSDGILCILQIDFNYHLLTI